MQLRRRAVTREPFDFARLSISKYDRSNETASPAAGIERRKHFQDPRGDRGVERDPNPIEGRAEASFAAPGICLPCSVVMGIMQIPGAQGACRCRGLWSYFLSGRPFRAADVLRAG
jgi:hypothetical protein